MDDISLERGERLVEPPAQRQKFPRNQWYVAAGCVEIGRELLYRKVAGEHVVFYRTEAGAAVAMSDWCPHRGFRLSNSKLRGDIVECGYHGIQFDQSGACVKIPSQPVIPDQMRARTFPLVEKGLWAWIWTGDQEKADPSKIPEVDPGKDEYFKTFVLCYPMKGNFQLIHDNLLDRVHPSYLHPGLLDNEGDYEIAAATPKVDINDSTITMTQTCKNFVPGRAVAQTFDLQEGVPVDRVLVTTAYLPSMYVINDTFFEAGNPSRIVAQQISYAPVTPVDEGNSIHFGGTVATFDVTDPGLAVVYRQVVAQDQLAVESAQAAFDEGGDSYREGPALRQDALALRARRMVAAMAAAEGQAAYVVSG